MRLIDADALMKAIKSFRWFGVPNTLKLMFDYLKIIINEQPTIEAAPVVHGRWKYVEVIGFGYLSTCSECGHHDHETNYCPNCGARMDGDGDA